MHRQYATTEEVRAGTVALTREAGRHLVTVLRLGVGDEVELFDGRGASAVFALAADGAVSDARSLLRDGRLRLERRGEVKVSAAPACRLVLGACVSKGKRMDWTVEKAVELGASEIIPIISENCVVAFDDDKACAEHRERWERIAIDAARQCSSPFVPEIRTPECFAGAVAALAKSGAEIYAGGLVPDAVPFRAALDARRAACKEPPERVAWLVGPEGDFSSLEYEALRAVGARLVSLGDLVLRTETAAIYGLCVLGCEWRHLQPSNPPNF